jgi:hypothetical protein
VRLRNVGNSFSRHGESSQKTSICSITAVKKLDLPLNVTITMNEEVEIRHAIIWYIMPCGLIMRESSLSLSSEVEGMSMLPQMSVTYYHSTRSDIPLRL